MNSNHRDDNTERTIDAGSQSNDRPSTQADVRARRPWKRSRIAGGCLVVFLAAIWFAPSLVLWLRKDWAEQQLSEETGLVIKIDSLSAGWFSSVRVGGLSVSTHDGDQVVEVDEVRTEKSLLGLLLRDREVGGIRVDSPVVHVPLEGAMAEELQAAAKRIDPRSGLLGKIVNPDRAAILKIEVVDGRVDMRPAESNAWKTVVESLNVVVDVDHKPDIDHIQLELPPTQIQLNPDLADHGLKFAAPVLAGSVDLDGLAELEIEQLDLKPQQWQDMRVRGTLVIEEANAHIQAKLIQSLAAIFETGDSSNSNTSPVPAETVEVGESVEADSAVTNTVSSSDASAAETQDDRDTLEPSGLDLQLARDSRVHFSVQEGVVHHDGLEFGLPELLPNVKLTSAGDVGFDETLDFDVALALPIEKLGDGPLLKKIGTPSLSVPVKGTFDDPEVGVGEGKLVGGLVKDVVDSLTDGNVDVEPILAKVKELKLLNRSNSDADETESTGDGGLLDRNRADDSEKSEEGSGRGRILDRIRRRFQREGSDPPEDDGVSKKQDSATPKRESSENQTPLPASGVKI